MTRETIAAVLEAAADLVEAVTFDDSGRHGQGGNGGLLSRETIRKADALRLALAAARAKREHDVDAATGESCA